LKAPKKILKNPICAKEVTDNFKGCLDSVAKAKGWDIVDVTSINKDMTGLEEDICGVVMGEPAFVAFVNKAIITYTGKVTLIDIDIMKDIKKGMEEPEEEGPTRH
jgi:hypothetical protein